MRFLTFTAIAALATATSFGPLDAKVAKPLAPCSVASISTNGGVTISAINPEGDGSVTMASARQPEGNGSVTASARQPEGNGSVTASARQPEGSGSVTASARQPEGSGAVTMASARRPEGTTTIIARIGGSAPCELHLQVTAPAR
jgi:hypothetical protein